MPTFRIVSIAGFFALINLLDKGGDPNAVSAFNTALTGDLGEAFNIISRRSQNLLLDNNVRSRLFQTLLTLGLVEAVLTGFDFRKSFTVGNFTVGI